ncbi:hypothetical protein PRSM4_208 [Prochlorococcus phage P-RSM4]|uniref:Uncharacterized protein n=1 Tax=Prochlorococcus phage P-RSM4 TaxID=444862 RepID=E3SM93_9CAUD|nr:hypothetical protein PRSM4_208 [Prochlorococcus phage P-RSM4]ADO98591.1 hypothetical protein PRSM4_208 [Prochlorococcus phage P-RSM4]
MTELQTIGIVSLGSVVFMIMIYLELRLLPLKRPTVAKD